VLWDLGLGSGGEFETRSVHKKAAFDLFNTL
jgi:hypothetical protein